MSSANDFVDLVAGSTRLLLECPIGASARIVYFGPALVGTPPEQVARMFTRQHAHGSAAEEAHISLANEIGYGARGAPGLAVHRSGEHWGVLLETSSIDRPSRNSVIITSEDARAGITLQHSFSIRPESEILEASVRLENTGAGVLSVDWCAAAILPLPPHADKLTGFTGRWAGEFQTEEVPVFTGTYLREHRAGRTSHDCFPGLLVAETSATETAGACFGFHLGWSGNSRLRADRLSDGRAFVQMGENFLPGEMTLEMGESYSTPTIYFGQSERGYSDLSQKFHSHIRSEILRSSVRSTPRPIHYNTWEAVYFDHDEDKLKALAEAAADVGAERFILDDGWFGGRRNDGAGLGDWHVSKDVYPSGLAPLIEHVRCLGMEFGIWLEPEMVNPDSDLYRRHPDWVLQVEGVPQVPSRNQYVLDLTRDEVSDHLFTVIDALLCEHEIDYIKWDMNRDVHHPGSNGRAVASRQTRAVYQLIDRVRAAHPDVQIESCASGGGRADYGILQRTDRIWTSDSNDALDRQIIQRGASHFFPLEVLGAHVGPRKCHITRRELSMELRVATALFGHMGMELNLLKETSDDLALLKAGVVLHKEHRALLHSGDFYRLQTTGDVNAIGVVAADKREALFSWCQMGGHKETLPGKMRLAGLDPEHRYRLKVIWPRPVPLQSRPSIIDALDLEGDGVSLSGDALMKTGFQAPLVYPQICVIYHLAAE